MAYIYHIPSWWPSRKSAHNGNYIYELVSNMALRNKNHHHTIAVFNTSLKWISVKHFFRDILELTRRDKPSSFTSMGNVDLVEIPRVIGMNPRTGINFIKSLVEKNIKIIQSLDRLPDLIHVHVSYPALIIGHHLSMKFNIPFLVTEHSSRFPDDRFDAFGYDQADLIRIFNHSKKIIAVSNFLANKFTPFKINPEVIYNFVRWDKPILNVVQKEKNIFSFLWIGRLNDQVKRLDILLSALKIIIQKGRQCTCTLIGDGVFLKYYKDLAVRLGIDAHLVWLGYTPSLTIQSNLSTVHCLVISSETETFGIAAIEALSYGLPVLSTACGGVEEIINSRCGLIVEKNNPDALSDGMEWMIDHHETFDCKYIQDYCYEHYDRHSIADQYLSVYNSIIPS